MIEFTLTQAEWIGTGLVIAFCFLMIWYMLAGSRMYLTAWHFVFMAAAGALIGLGLQQYTALIDWITLGVTFTNLGATMFFIGLLSMTAVMVWNLIKTNGETLVR